MVRVWVDGCFDTMHYGHANALRQARLMGDTLVVGVHSDQEILKNKGPTIMNNKERYAAVRYCKYADIVVEDAPYTTELKYLEEYDCDFCVHGDDTTLTSDGSDCYRLVKQANKYKECKRTKGVSTTNLVKRMLERLDNMVGSPSTHEDTKTEELELFSNNTQPSGKVLLVDGIFDMFHIDHMEYLKSYKDQGYYIVVNIMNEIDSQKKSDSYPIMNMYERALCVLACKVILLIVL